MSSRILVIIHPFFCRYDAVIDAITDDGLVAITFDGFGNSDVTKLSALKDRIPGEKRGLHRPGFGDSDKNKYVNQLAIFSFSCFYYPP